VALMGVFAFAFEKESALLVEQIATSRD